MLHSPKCPHCRETLSAESLVISVAEDSAEDPAEAPCKIEALRTLLATIFARPQPAKVLIFSEHERIFGMVDDILTENNVANSRVVGSASSISSTLNKFQQSGTKAALLLNSRHCGSGLNIETATDVIIYHSMSHELETQVIGRAQRPGRTTTLNVWKLRHENELVG